MKKFPFAVLLAVSLALAGCGSADRDPAFVEPDFKEIDCVAEPYHFACRQPSTEQPIPN